MKESDNIQEIQMIEQTIQNLLLQKQAFQMELSETQQAIEEIRNAGEEVFKIIGQLMLKTDKKKIEEELKNKEKLLNLRVTTMEKQENTLSKKLISLRDAVVDSK
jgi:prefoldin beta subunit